MRRAVWCAPVVLLAVVLMLAGASACSEQEGTVAEVNPVPIAPSASTTATSPPTVSPSPTQSPSGNPALVAQGKSLSASLGCMSCHSIDGSAGIGPTWKGLSGSQVALTNGQTVSATDAYLLSSIQDPDAQIVAGYKAGIMSAVIKPGSVSAADAAALIAYIKSLP
jgi:cytochrome c oxidase subunit II